MTGLRYVCSKCGQQMATDRAKPAHGWVVARDPALRWRCAGCGCFAVPLEVAQPLQSLGRNAYWAFSGCPNAWECNLHDQYDGDCEEGRVMQKCFVALHAELGIANHFLKALTQPNPQAAPEVFGTQSPPN
jgi:hypothetical protein